MVVIFKHIKALGFDQNLVLNVHVMKLVAVIVGEKERGDVI